MSKSYVENRLYDYAYITKIFRYYYIVSDTPNGPGDYFEEKDLELDYKYYRRLKLEKINESTL